MGSLHVAVDFHLQLKYWHLGHDSSRDYYDFTAQSWYLGMRAGDYQLCVSCGH